MSTTRRDFVKASLAAGAGLFLPLGFGSRNAAAQVPGGTLPPAAIPKYRTRLWVPPAMPKSGPRQYEIAVRQFGQQILPGGLPRTTVWGYGSADHPSSFHYPSRTIEATCEQPLQVTWTNGLMDSSGGYLPHLLPVDPTLHWANPPGGVDGRDTKPSFLSTPNRYTGPVPMVPHLHGAHVGEESDGYPEAWFLPSARNIPAGYATQGTFYNQFKKAFRRDYGGIWQPGSATFHFGNTQAATALWFHDHTLGMTRLNVYAGPAGMYLLRGGSQDLPDGMLPGPAPTVGATQLDRFYEIPLVIQDRSFNADGSLFYPDSREFFDGIAGPYIPTSDLPPLWNPEFFANTMVVNGNTWPYLEVERRRYRFRLLNACNSRFLILKVVSNPMASRPASPALPLWQIGGDGGFLKAPAEQDQLLMAPSERADIVIDFSKFPQGTELYLINEGPDEPFGGGAPGTDFAAADPYSTGQVMKFVVGRLASQDTSVPPSQLTLPRLPRSERARVTRRLSLNEVMSEYPGFDGPAMALLGTVDPAGNAAPEHWEHPVSENPKADVPEIWELHNFTEDAHPVHIHQVQFEVLDRQSMDGSAARPPEAGETGRKDTVIAYPGEITRVRLRFDRTGLFVWHCHILEHEDNEMMRPLIVEG